MSRIANYKPCTPAASSPVANAPGSPGRDERGRFIKGNKGGPGNPFARQVAALRRQLVESVTPEIMAQICTALLMRAQGGNLAAINDPAT